MMQRVSRIYLAMVRTFGNRLLNTPIYTGFVTCQRKRSETGGYGQISPVLRQNAKIGFDARTKRVHVVNSKRLPNCGEVGPSLVDRVGRVLCE